MNLGGEAQDEKAQATEFERKLSDNKSNPNVSRNSLSYLNETTGN